MKQVTHSIITSDCTMGVLMVFFVSNNSTGRLWTSRSQFKLQVGDYEMEFT